MTQNRIIPSKWQVLYGLHESTGTDNKVAMIRRMWGV